MGDLSSKGERKHEFHEIDRACMHFSSEICAQNTWWTGRASDNLGGMSRFYALGVLVLACATERQPNVTDEERMR
jgi:hypothetical protein